MLRRKSSIAVTLASALAFAGVFGTARMAVTFAEETKKADHAESSAGKQPGALPVCEAAEAALKELQAGNKRYAEGAPTRPHVSQERREDTVSNGQAPIVAVLACADSRSPLEILFDQGIGDVFAIRVAGNPCNVDELASIEYGVEHLHIPLVVVLGHSQCGAMKAIGSGAVLPEHLNEMLEDAREVRGELQRERPDLKGDYLIDQLIRKNVLRSMEDILTDSEVVRGEVIHGKTMVVGGVYNLQSGAVEWLGRHPREAEYLLGDAAGSEKH